MTEQTISVSSPTKQPQRPTTNDRAEWSKYWHALEQEWRTEPEIDEKRQQYLITRMKVHPDDAKIGPFVTAKLSRADVEWLIARSSPDPFDFLAQQFPVLRSDPKKFYREMHNFVFKQHKLDLSGADMQSVDLSGINFSEVRLYQAALGGADLRKSFLDGAHLEYAHLDGALLQEASLRHVHLNQATLMGVHLEKTDLTDAHLEGVNLRNAYLAGAWLCGSFLDNATKLDDVHLANEKDGSVLLANVHWNDVDLTGVDWSQLPILGDEKRAKQTNLREHTKREKAINGTHKTRLYLLAVRTYRRLAVALQEQGMSDEASHFAYRAQLLQRIVLRRQKKWGQYLFSLFLDVLSGYGYKPLRSFIAYLFVICLFTLIYSLVGSRMPLNEAFVVSMAAFHGRGFFPGTFSPGDPLAFVSVFEAFIGLVIEVTFIAALTQRFFGK